MAGEDKFAYTDILLPSRGALYGDKIPDGRVAVRRTRVREEEALFSTGGSAIEKMAQFLSVCLKLPDPTFNPLDLLATDRMFIMLGIRAMTYGTLYKMSWTCRSCRKSNTTNVDLTTDLNEITPANVEARIGIKRAGWKYAEPFEVLLPDEGVTVGFRMLRGRDEADAIREANRYENDRAMFSTSLYAANAAKLITHVDGKQVHQLIAANLIDNLTGKDNSILTQAFDDMETGIDPVINRACHSCGADNSLGVSLSREMFRYTGD